MHKNYLLFLTCLLFSCNTLLAQGGTLDPSFNQGGILEMKLFGARTGFFRTLLQPDGKILAIAAISDTANIQSAVLRFHSDGTPDLEFADNGVYATANDWPYHLGADGMLLLDGKILVVDDIAYQNVIAVTRLLPNGVRDSAFADNGVSYISIDFPIYSPYPSRSFLQPDGKIVIIGEYEDIDSEKTGGFVMRVLPDGNLDTSFGNQGIKTFHGVSGNPDLRLFGGKVQPDGKIVLAGRMGSMPEEQFWYVARIHPDGSFDTSFDSDGIVMPNIGSQFGESAFEIHILSNGKILAAGYGQKLPGQHFTVMRFNPNGSVDNTFGLGGKAQVDFGCCHSYIFDIVEQTDGKLVLAGLSDEDNVHTRFSVARIKPNGFVDQEFGDLGKVLVLIQHDSISARATSALIQPDGKILLSGLTTNDVDGYTVDGLLVRLNPGGQVGIVSPNQNLDLQLSASPNPFYGTQLQLEYQLEEATELTISIFNTLGQVVQRPIDMASRSSGSHVEALQMPNELPVGEYFVQLQTSEGRQWIKIIKSN